MRRSLRAAGRVAWVFLHLAVGVLTALLLFPMLDRERRDRRVQRWATRLLAILGVRVSSHGRPPAAGQGALLVANHVSWLDIHLIHSRLPARFVAKAEVRGWPLIGWLAEHAGGTLFLERSRKRDARRVSRHMVERLRGGECLAVFPEGTTSSGAQLLPFYPSLFQPAIEAGVPVWPVLVRYLTRDGTPCRQTPYFGDMSLLRSLLRIAANPGVDAELRFLEPLTTAAGQRRDLAARAEAAIRDALAAAGGGNGPERSADPPTAGR